MLSFFIFYLVLMQRGSGVERVSAGLAWDLLVGCGSLPGLLAVTGKSWVTEREREKAWMEGCVGLAFFFSSFARGRGEREMKRHLLLPQLTYRYRKRKQQLNPNTRHRNIRVKLCAYIILPSMA